MRAVTGLIAQIIIAAIFIVGGGFLVWWALQHESHTLVWVGIGVSIFGALLAPGILPLATNIYVTFFPNGLPLIGGRRAGDPPAPPSDPV